MGHMFSVANEPVSINSQGGQDKSFQRSNDCSSDLNNETLIKLARATGSQIGEVELLNQLMLHQKNDKSALDSNSFQVLINSLNNQQNKAPKPVQKNEQRAFNKAQNNFMKQQAPAQQQQMDLNAFYQLLLQQNSAMQNHNQNVTSFPQNRPSQQFNLYNQKKTNQQMSQVLSNMNVKGNSSPFDSHQSGSMPKHNPPPSNMINSRSNMANFPHKTNFQCNQNPNLQGSSTLIQQTREPAYHPQVEAISPAPEDARILDPNDIRLQKDREEVTRQMRLLDHEIGRHEAHLRNLNERENSLNVSLNEKSKNKDSSKPENLPKFNNSENPIQSILSETRLQCKRQSMIFNRICGPNVSCLPNALPLYKQSSDLPAIKQIQFEFLHNGFKDKLIKYIKKRKLANKARLELYAKKYNQVSKSHNKKLSKYFSSASKRQKDAKYREIFEKMFPEVKKIINERERALYDEDYHESLSYGQGQSIENDTASSYDPVEEMKKMKEYAVDTPITLPPWERHKEFLWTSGRIEDPLVEHTKDQDLSFWTDDEKIIFKERYIVTPKNFASIASYLDKKTVGDCILYYYRTKKKEAYKSLVKKSHVKRRRGPGNNNSQGYKGTTSPVPRVPQQDDSGSESVDNRNDGNESKKRGPKKRFTRTKEPPSSTITTTTSKETNPSCSILDKRKRSYNSSPTEESSQKSDIAANIPYKRGFKFEKGRNDEDQVTNLSTTDKKPETSINNSEDNSRNEVSTEVKEEPKESSPDVSCRKAENPTACVQDLLNLAIEKNLVNIKKSADEKSSENNEQDNNATEKSSVPEASHSVSTIQKEILKEQKPNKPLQIPTSALSLDSLNQQGKNTMQPTTIGQHHSRPVISNPLMMSNQFQHSRHGQSEMSNHQPPTQQPIPQTHSNPRLQPTQQSNSENAQIEFLIQQVLSTLHQSQSASQQNQNKAILEGLIKMLVENQKQAQISSGSSNVGINKPPAPTHQNNPLIQPANPSTIAENNNRTSADSLMASVFNSISQKMNRSTTPNNHSFQPHHQMHHHQKQPSSIMNQMQNRPSSSQSLNRQPTASAFHPSGLISSNLSRAKNLDTPGDLSMFLRNQNPPTSSDLQHNQSGQLNQQQTTSINQSLNSNPLGSQKNFNFVPNSAASFLFENYYASQQLNNNQNNQNLNQPAQQQPMVNNIRSNESGFHPFTQQQSPQQHKNIRRSIDPNLLPSVKNIQRIPPNSQQLQQAATSNVSMNNMLNQLASSSMNMNQGHGNNANASLFSSIMATLSQQNTQQQQFSQHFNAMNSNKNPANPQSIRNLMMQQTSMKNKPTSAPLNPHQQTHPQLKGMFEAEQQHQQNKNNASHPYYYKSSNQQMNMKQGQMPQPSERNQNTPQENNPFGMFGSETEMTAAINAFVTSIKQSQNSNANMQEFLHGIAKSNLNQTQNTVREEKTPKKNFTCYSPLSPNSPNNETKPSTTSPDRDSMRKFDDENLSIGGRKDTGETHISPEASHIIKTLVMNDKLNTDAILMARSSDKKNSNDLDDSQRKDFDDNLSTGCNSDGKNSQSNLSDLEEEAAMETNYPMNTTSKISIKKSLDDSSKPHNFIAPDLPDRHSNEEFLDKYRKRGFTDSQINLREQRNQMVNSAIMMKKSCKRLDIDQRSIETLSLASPENHLVCNSASSINENSNGEIDIMKTDASVCSLSDEGPTPKTEAEPGVDTTSTLINPSVILDSIIQKNLFTNDSKKKEDIAQTQSEEPAQTQPDTQTCSFDSLNDRIIKVIRENISTKHNISNEKEEKSLNPTDEVISKKRIKLNPSISEVQETKTPPPEEKKSHASPTDSHGSNQEDLSPLNLQIDLNAENKSEESKTE